MATAYKPTPLQRQVLAYVANRASYRSELADRGASHSEALDTLEQHQYVTFKYIRGDWIIDVTDEGRTLAEQLRSTTERLASIARVPACPSCVVQNCVCRIKLACLGDGPHSLGCHGTHD